MKRWIEFLDQHQLHFLDFLRIYLGAYLILKGIEFTGRMDSLLALIGQTGSLYLDLGIAHYVLVTNIVGGLFLLVGLLTRWAALINIPNLLGALFLLGRSQSFFARGSDLPVTLFVALMVIVFTLAGAGPLSIDHYMREYARKHNLGLDTMWEHLWHR